MRRCSILVKSQEKLKRNFIECNLCSYQRTILFYCTNFSKHYNFLDILKNKKFGIVGKPWPSGTSKLKIFCKKEALKLKNIIKMKMFNFLSKIAAVCGTWLRKLQRCLITKIYFSFWFIVYFRGPKREFEGI